MITAGVDGCRGGWVVATLTGGRTARKIEVDLTLAEDFGAVLRATEPCEAVAIDVPIGLPSRGERSCDVAARRLLRGRASSVFRSPVREVLGASTHEEANAISRRVAGVGISAQSFALVPVIRQVDARMTPALQQRVFEVHPEVCFQQALNEEEPLGSGKRSAVGAALRLRLLRAVGLDALAAVDALASTAPPDVAGAAALDDVLDALAAAWTARRRALGRACDVVPRVERDARGLVMQMAW